MFGRSIAAMTICFTGLAAMAAEPIDGRTASRWRAQPGWTPARLAEGHDLSADGGWLVMTVKGQGKQMTWLLSPSAAEMAGEPRWLVMWYQSRDMAQGKGDMFLSFRAPGSQAWNHLADSRQMIADGEPHLLAFDLWSWELAGPMEHLLVRAGPTAAAEGQLRIKLQMMDEPPAEAKKLSRPPIKPQQVVLQMADFKWTPSPNWTPRPPESHDAHKTEQGMLFSMKGQNRSMRWASKLASAIDFKETPHAAVRYRAKGDFGPWGYVFYLLVPAKDGKNLSVYPMQPGDVVSDGAWHVHRVKVDSGEKAASTIAVGIDCLSPDARIEIDTVTFSSSPVLTPIGKAITLEPRKSPWPQGQQGMTTLEVPKAKSSSPLLLRRMGISDWLRDGEMTFEGIPFRVTSDPGQILTSGTVDEDDLEVPIGREATELLVLLLSAFPSGEKFGATWQHDTPLQNLDEPERLAIELRYGDGSADQVIPIRVSSGTYGVGRDIVAYAIHPAAGKRVDKMIFHDRMRNAAFGVLGVTVNNRAPRIPEPVIQQAAYPRRTPAAAAPAKFNFHVGDSWSWKSIESPMLGKMPLKLDGQPVFRLKLDAESAKAVGREELTSIHFICETVEAKDGVTRITSVFKKDNIELRATFTSTPQGPAQTLLALDLNNVSGQTVTGTLFFPAIAGVQIGKLDDTWYFCARRGGVINRVPAKFRDEIGEPHPLQVDGFFNPEIGAGISFQPRDTTGTFRWYNVAKDDKGCGYSLEFMPQTIAPGKSWRCIDTAVAVMPGDWRDQLRTYQQWLATWFKPLAPRKEWYRQLWSFVSAHPATPASFSLEQRLDFPFLAKRREKIVPGSADYIHLFGWALTKKYGHWGAYDHYETVGDQPTFKSAVEKSKKVGVPVGLYLDGYLVSTASDKPMKDQVEKWAVRDSKGKPLYHASYDAHSLCPYVPQWRDYLTAVYKRVADEVNPSGMYVDEFGECMVHRTCYSKDHGHPSPMGMSPGEWIMAKQIREAVPPQIATYCEYVPADVGCQYFDGAYGHVSLYNYRDGYQRYAPHFVNLQRFALPDFKTFELIYYVPLANGNWFLWKYPFFNGDGYYLTGQEWEGLDEHAAAFLTKIFELQHAHKDAFSSTDVEPLVETSQSGLYANRFSITRKTVWTLFNANYRTTRGQILSVPHKNGLRYWDAWNKREISPVVRGNVADIPVELGPRAVGCIVQQP